VQSLLRKPRLGNGHHTTPKRVRAWIMNKGKP
jgi:hypothetical protein